MAEIKANGTEIINCGDEIIRLTNLYKTEINRLYELLSKINVTAWSGVSADRYVGRLYAENVQLNSFATNLELYGKVIKNIGENVNKLIEKWEAK